MPKVIEEDLPEYRRIGFSGQNYKIVKGSLEGTTNWLERRAQIAIREALASTFN